MRTKSNFYIGLVLAVLAILLFFAACFVPVGAPARAFKSVNDDKLVLLQMLEKTCDDEIQVYEDFAICDGELYLWTQTHYRCIIIGEYLKRKKWSCADVQALRSAHAELDSLWPDSTKANGGVIWIIDE